MVTVITDRIVIIDGFIVDKRSRCIISKTRAKNYLSTTKFKNLCREYVVSQETLSQVGGVVLELDNKSELFDHIDCQIYDFNVMADNTLQLKNDRVSRRNKRNIEGEVAKFCHKYVYAGKRSVYLSCKDTSFTADVDMLDFDPNLRKVKDTSVMVRVLKADEFEFTEQDFNALKEYTPEEDARYQGLGVRIVELSFPEASRNAGNYVGPDLHTGYSSLIKKLDPATRKVYGRRLGSLLFVLFNSRSLGPFAGDAVPDDIELCVDISRAPETVKYLGNLFREALIDSKHQGFLVRWIRMSAVNFEDWNYYEESFPMKQARTLRQSLDAVRALIKFTSFAVSHEGLEEAIKTEDNQRFFKVFRLFYSAVAGQERTIASTHVNVDPENGRVLVRNKVLSFELLSSMKQELHNTFRACIGMLGRWVSYGNVAVVYQNTMGNPLVNIRDETSIDNRHRSLFQSLPIEMFNGYRMEWFSDGDASSAAVAGQFLEIVNKMTKVLMVCVWLSPGTPLRFPELNIMTFAGEGRNLYIDVIDRIFYIKSAYNKNRKFENRLLFLDKVVSGDLLWFIYILRPFVVKMLSQRLSEFQNGMVVNQLSREIETELTEEEAENQEEEDEELYSRTEVLDRSLRGYSSLGNAILKMFVFVDVRNMRHLPVSGEFMSGAHFRAACEMKI